MKFQSKEKVEANLGKIKSHLENLRTIQFLISENYEVYLVGGATRDFLLSGELSRDLDFEIQNKNEKSLKPLIESVEQQLSQLKLDYKIKFSYLSSI